MTEKQINDMSDLLHDAKLIRKRIDGLKKGEWIGISRFREEGQPLISSYANNRLNDFLASLNMELMRIIEQSTFKPYIIHEKMKDKELEDGQQ